MNDKDIVIYLHDLARALNSSDLRYVADRFADLSKKEIEDGLVS